MKKILYLLFFILINEPLFSQNKSNQVRSNNNKISTNVDLDYLKSNWDSIDLKVSIFRDKKEIKIANTPDIFMQLDNNPAVYIDKKTGFYYYNFKAISNSSNLAPYGYYIPQRDEIDNSIKQGQKFTNKLAENLSNFNSDKLNYSYSGGIVVSEGGFVNKDRYKRLWLNSVADDDYIYILKIDTLSNNVSVDFEPSNSGFTVRCKELLEEKIKIKNDYDYQFLMPDSFNLLVQKFEKRIRNFLPEDKSHFVLEGKLTFDFDGKNTSERFDNFDATAVEIDDLKKDISNELKLFNAFPYYKNIPISCFTDFRIDLLYQDRYRKVDSQNKSIISSNILDSEKKSYLLSHRGELNLKAVTMRINDKSKSFSLINSVKLKGAGNAFYCLIPGLGFTKVGLSQGKYSPFLYASIPSILAAIGGYYYSNNQYDKYKNEGYNESVFSQANLANKVFISATITYGALLCYDLFRTIKNGIKNKRKEKELNLFIYESKNKIEYRYENN